MLNEREFESHDRRYMSKFMTSFFDSVVGFQERHWVADLCAAEEKSWEQEMVGRYYQTTSLQVFRLNKLMVMISTKKKMHQSLPVQSYRWQLMLIVVCWLVNTYRQTTGWSRTESGTSRRQTVRFFAMILWRLTDEKWSDIYNIMTLEIK